MENLGQLQQYFAYSPGEQMLVGGINLSPIDRPTAFPTVLQNFDYNVLLMAFIRWLAGTDMFELLLQL